MAQSNAVCLEGLLSCHLWKLPIAQEATSHRSAGDTLMPGSLSGLVLGGFFVWFSFGFGGGVGCLDFYGGHCSISLGKS